MVKQFTVISTFAGCGGSSLGYKMAGFKELLAIDFDKNACETFRLNFDCPIWQRDIKIITAEEILNFCKIKKEELDILDGSPPCQGFSTAGKRQVNDLRNDLFKEFVRLIDGLQPKIFVMENVSGMIKGKMKGIFKEILLTLKSLPYRVKCKLMNAKYYEVPQSRQRLIFIGVRNDLKLDPIFPKSQKNIITASMAIPNLIATRSMKINQWMDASRSAAIICRTDSDYQAIFISEKDMDEARIKQSWQIYRVLKKMERKKHFSMIRINPHRPSPTITKDAGNTCTGMIHPFEMRKLTIPEIKRLQSFPDEFKLIGNFGQKWAMIGNSVPPNFMKAIALNLKENILMKIDLNCGHEFDPKAENCRD